MRRPGPHSLSAALEAAASEASPPGLLPLVQTSWPRVAGEAIAAQSEPTGEREGVITVACSSAAWAHELELLGGDLLRRLNAALEDRHGAVGALRFVVRSGVGGPAS